MVIFMSTVCQCWQFSISSQWKPFRQLKTHQRHRGSVSESTISTPDVDSDSSWVPRAKVHYKWLVHLELAKIRSSSYVLTEIGDGVLNKLRQSTLTNGIRYRSILALHYRLRLVSASYRVRDFKRIYRMPSHRYYW